jgi:hypothetical protein
MMQNIFHICTIIFYFGSDKLEDGDRMFFGAVEDLSLNTAIPPFHSSSRQKTTAAAWRYFQLKGISIRKASLLRN